MKVDAHSMLEREVAIMKKVNHPSIVRLHEVMDCKQDDKLYLVLEYMDFGSLLSPAFFRKRTQTEIHLFEEPVNQILERHQVWQFFR